MIMHHTVVGGKCAQCVNLWINWIITTAGARWLYYTYRWMRFFQRIADRTAWHTVFSPPDEWNLHSTGIPSTRRHCDADERTRIRVPGGGCEQQQEKEVREIRSEFQISLMIYYTLYKRILREEGVCRTSVQRRYVTWTSWNGPRHWQPIRLNLHIVVLK